MGDFYSAESYHQDYLEKNPSGYCPNHTKGVKFQKDDMNIDITMPLGGKEILVIKSEAYCPYCEKFAEDVSSLYKGSLPLRTVVASSLKDIDIKTKLFATPTILFIEDGKEVMAHSGYMDKKSFYRTLKDYKLGKILKVTM